MCLKRISQKNLTHMKKSVMTEAQGHVPETHELGKPDLHKEIHYDRGTSEQEKPDLC